MLRLNFTGLFTESFLCYCIQTQSFRKWICFRPLAR